MIYTQVNTNEVQYLNVTYLGEQLEKHIINYNESHSGKIDIERLTQHSYVLHYIFANDEVLFFSIDADEYRAVLYDSNVNHDIAIALIPQDEDTIARAFISEIDKVAGV